MVWPAAGADVDDDAVVGRARLRARPGDELEHPLRLVGLELVDLAEGVDVPLREHEQVRLRLRVDVADRDEPLAVATWSPSRASRQKRHSSGSEDPLLRHGGAADADQLAHLAVDQPRE